MKAPTITLLFLSIGCAYCQNINTLYNCEYYNGLPSNSPGDTIAVHFSDTNTFAPNHNYLALGFQWGVGTTVMNKRLR